MTSRTDLVEQGTPPKKLAKEKLTPKEKKEKDEAKKKRDGI